MIKNFLIIIAVLIGIFFGFLQEFVKVNINYTLEAGDKILGFYEQNATTKKAWIQQTAVDAPFDYYHNHKKIDSLLNLDKSQLDILKWVVTLIFIAVFLTINVLILKLITNDRKLIIWFIKLYGVFFLIAAMLYVFGKLTNTLTQSYAVSREIAGGLQSMVPVMLALPAWWLLKRTQISHKK